jgi:hypothetical protein
MYVEKRRTAGATNTVRSQCRLMGGSVGLLSIANQRLPVAGFAKSASRFGAARWANGQ